MAKGVRVLTVHPDSPAEGAKLKGDKAAGDLILAVGGSPVTSPDSLAEAIKEYAIRAQKVPLLVFSGGKYKTVNITLKAPPEKSTTNAAELPAADDSTTEKKSFFKTN